MRLRILGAALLVSAAPAVAQNPAPTAAPAAAPRPPLPNDSVAIARRYWNWFATAQADSIFNHLPAEARAQAGSAQSMMDQFTQIMAQVGNETQLVEERWVRRNGRRQYWRIGRYSEFTDEPVVVRIVILPDGGLGGLGVNPLSRVPEVDPEP